MPDPYQDLLLFDWAHALQSTVLASRLLETPQSTISRRVRAFQADHRLVIRRHHKGLRLLSPPEYLEDYRKVAQLHRLLQGDLRWAAHPCWAEHIQCIGAHHGQFLNFQAISLNELGAIDDPVPLWFNQRLLDAYLDLIISDHDQLTSWSLGLSHEGVNLDSTLNRMIQLGPLAGVPGLDEALAARGWTVVTGSGPTAIPTLTLIAPQAAGIPPGIRPLDLWVRPQWRYADILPIGNAHVSSGIKQFENHQAISLACLTRRDRDNDSERLETDPLFTFSALP